jgi:NADP-dependent 3-hydroxy acid dehydrogenase YdfG
MRMSRGTSRRSPSSSLHRPNCCTLGPSQARRGGSRNYNEVLAEAAVDDRIAPCALITGGAGGVGKAVCELLSDAGFLVAVADRDELGARAVADACGGFAFTLDIADEASVIATMERAVEALGGRLDALAIAASAADAVPRTDDEVVAFARVHAVHVVGAYLCIREATKRMEAGGRICTVAPSANSHGGGVPSGPLHAAARGALVELTRHAADALSANGVAVNGVAPSQATSAEHVAEAVAWLLSPRAAGINGEVLMLEARPP